MVQRRRGQRPGEETPFVDLAFSILGPVAALMLVFLVVSGRPSEPSPCRKPNDREAQALAEQVSAWWRSGREQTGAAQHFLDEACPKWQESADKPTPVPGRPDVLSDVCPAESQAIVRRAGIGTADIAMYFGEQRAIRQALTKCRLPPTPCRIPSVQEAKALLEQVSRWWRTGQERDREAQRFLNETCPGWRGTGANPTPIAGRPEVLLDVCPAEAKAILRRAGIREEALASFLGDERAITRSIGQCRASQEVITITEDQLRFETCKAEIKASDQFFVEKARQIQATLRGHPYNRIDIFGHSDPRPVSNCSVDVALPEGGQITVPVRDNEMLSLLRAYAFRNRFVRAIEDTPEFADIDARLAAHTLRLYAIGVGAAEPKATEAESRRIEIRFVLDNRTALQ